MAKSIEGLSFEWNNFILCVLLHFSVPFLSIGLEKLFRGVVSDSNLIIFTSIYSLSIGLSSRNSVIGILCFIISLIFSSIYGFMSKDEQSSVVSIWVVVGVLILIIIPHLLERYNRHYIEQEIFLKWQLHKNQGVA